MPKWFAGMSGREQGLLLVLLWGGLLVGLTVLGKKGKGEYDNWALARESLDFSAQSLDEKKDVFSNIEKLKSQQANRSYDLEKLYTHASALATEVSPQFRYKRGKTLRTESYVQYTVHVDCPRATYENVQNYVKRIRGQSPYMFFTEVRIKPKYPPKTKPYDPVLYDVDFDVSSVVFANRRN